MRCALILLLLLPLATAHCSGSEPTPRWKTRVEQFGYESAPRKMFQPVRLSAAFTDNGHVVIGWIAPIVTKDNKHTSPKLGEAAHVHVVVIDAKTGQKQGEKEWQTRFTYSVPLLARTDDGNFLLCTDDAVRVVSVMLDTVQEKHLSAHASCKISPSGHTLLVTTVLEQTRRMELLNTKTFKILSSWTEQFPDGDRTFAISDRELLGSCAKPAELCIRRFNEGWRPFRVAGQQRRMAAAESIIAAFVNDQTIGIASTTLMLTSTDGAVLRLISPTDKRLFGSPPIPSSTGESFVVVEGRMRGVRNDVLDMYPFYATDNATVYRIKDDHPLFSLKLQGTSPWTGHIIDNVAALSPDGRSLALISDGVLEVFGVTDGTEKP